MTNDDLVHETAKRIHAVTESITSAAMSGLAQQGDTSPPHHLYVMLTAACAAINAAAKIMTMPLGDHESEEARHWSQEPTDRRAIVAAAMLLARCMVPTHDGMNMEVNAANIKAALHATEKVLGVIDTTIFSENMMKAANKCSAPVNFLDNGGHEIGDLDQNRTLN